MNKSAVLSTLQKRLRQFMQHGYDLSASRKNILKNSGIRQGSVLEIGTGKGHLTAFLAKKGLRVTSIDLDSESHRFAKAHLSALGLNQRVLFQRMNAEKLRFPDLSFDHVISVDFFHHAARPFQCLQEMMRVARDTLTIADLNKRGIRKMDLIHRSEGRKHELFSAPFQELKKRLQTHGFNVKHYRHSCHQVFVAKRRSL